MLAIRRFTQNDIFIHPVPIHSPSADEPHHTAHMRIINGRCLAVRCWCHEPWNIHQPSPRLLIYPCSDSLYHSQTRLNSLAFGDLATIETMSHQPWQGYRSLIFWTWLPVISQQVSSRALSNFSGWDQFVWAGLGKVLRLFIGVCHYS